jgi:CRP/FNR family nitrogen fixation transcriptional regulator
MPTLIADDRCSVNCFDDCSLPPSKSRKSSSDEPIAHMGKIVQYKRGAEIFGQGQLALYLYRVLTGAVRTVWISNGGRRQIREFYLPGDYFGLEIASAHALSAFAISDAQIRVINLHTIAKLTGRRKDVTHQLLRVKDDELIRLQDQTLLLNKTAEERIAWFLVRMTGRSETSKFLTLPMPRKDVAEHLGLTIETVSRTMRQLESAGLIKSLSRRRIQILNEEALQRLVS